MKIRAKLISNIRARNQFFNFSKNGLLKYFVLMVFLISCFNGFSQQNKPNILSFGLNFSNAPEHDVALAVFHLYEVDGKIQTDITFDLEDFHLSLDISTDEVNLGTMQSYLYENTSFQFNNEVRNLIITEVEIIRGHIKVEGSFGKIEELIKTIKIENSCLLNIDHHSNVIEIDLNDTSRDYRMNKDRRIISVEL